MTGRRDNFLVPSEGTLLELIEHDAGRGEIATTRRGVADATRRRLGDLGRMQEALRQCAERVVTDARQDLELHDVDITCVKRRGHTYHLYEREGRRWFSLLGPDDYRSADPKARFCGTFCLHYDNSWEAVD